METINYNGTTICVLDDNDMLTDCPINSYAIIEDSGHYVAVHVEKDVAPAIHTDPVDTLEDALDIIAERCDWFYSLIPVIDGIQSVTGPSIAIFHSSPEFP